MEITHEQEMQGYLDAISAIAVAIARQIDAARFAEDLKALANLADAAGHGPSAALIDEIVRGVDIRVLNKKGH